MLVLVVAHLTSPSNLTNALRIFRRYGRRSSPPLERRLVTPQSYARALGLGDRVAQLQDRNAAMFSGARSGAGPPGARVTGRRAFGPPTGVGAMPLHTPMTVVLTVSCVPGPPSRSFAPALGAVLAG